LLLIVNALEKGMRICGIRKIGKFRNGSEAEISGLAELSSVVERIADFDSVEISRLVTSANGQKGK